jgi:SAM-dependent methyltransferase
MSSNHQASFKDLFSGGSREYARYRPKYPHDLLAWVSAESPRRTLAVDVATGNGQAAAGLADYFELVVGLDASIEQLRHAERNRRVRYVRATAEATPLTTASVDTLVAAQAFHWFRRDAFFSEVNRITRPGGLIALWTYFLATIEPRVDQLVRELYEGLLGPYWEPERKLVEDGYASVVFPFVELTAPTFDMITIWTFDHLAGYLATWSPTRRYVEDHGTHPLAQLFSALREAWGEPTQREVRWPLRVRAFRR